MANYTGTKQHATTTSRGPRATFSKVLLKCYKVIIYLEKNNKNVGADNHQRVKFNK